MQKLMSKDNMFDFTYYEEEKIEIRSATKELGALRVIVWKPGVRVASKDTKSGTAKVYEEPSIEFGQSQNTNWTLGLWEAMNRAIKEAIAILNKENPIIQIPANFTFTGKTKIIDLKDLKKKKAQSNISTKDIEPGAIYVGANGTLYLYLGKGYLKRYRTDGEEFINRGNKMYCWIELGKDRMNADKIYVKNNVLCSPKDCFGWISCVANQRKICSLYKKLDPFDKIDVEYPTGWIEEYTF